MERFVRPTDTPESQKPKEVSQPLAAALLESAQWWQLNKAEKMTAEDAQELASAQAARAEQLVPFLQEYGYGADNKPQPASEQLANRESALYRDALAASYIQELEAQGIELSDVELVANDVPLSDELPKSEQRRLLLPIEHALRAAEYEQQRMRKTKNLKSLKRIKKKKRMICSHQWWRSAEQLLGRGNRHEVGVTSSSDKSAMGGC